MRLFAERPALGEEVGGVWRWVSWGEVRERAENVALALRDELKPGSFVGICAANSLSWVVSFLAVLLGRFVAVPMHRTSSSAVLQHIAQEARLALVFSDLDSSNFGQVPLVHISGGSPSSLAELEERGSGDKENKPDLEQPTCPIEDPLLVFYTSGSTGLPKGAILSNGAFNFELVARLRCRGPSRSEAVAIDLLTYPL